MEADASTLGAGTYARVGKSRTMPDGFERLFTEQYPRVVAIAYRILRDQAEAEDVAQEVFLAFHRKHSPVADYAAAWLHRAAVHTALNSIRSRNRRQRREAVISEPEDSVGPGVDEIVEANEQRRAVRQALARLPAKSAAVLALRSSGLTYAETAAALGVNIGQIGTMLRRAEARLLKEVQK